MYPLEAGQGRYQLPDPTGIYTELAGKSILDYGQADYNAMADKYIANLSNKDERKEFVKTKCLYKELTGKVLELLRLVLSQRCMSNHAYAMRARVAPTFLQAYIHMCTRTRSYMDTVTRAFIRSRTHTYMFNSSFLRYLTSTATRSRPSSNYWNG